MSIPELAQAIGVSPRQLMRYEADEQGPPLPVSNRLCKSLDVSLDELAGNRPIGLNLAGDWHARWQTTRDGVPTVDAHTITAAFASTYVVFRATSGDYAWRGDMKLTEGAIEGTYHSTDSGRRSRGVMRLTLSAHGDYALGTWAGLWVDGIHGVGWGVIARDEAVSDRLIKSLMDRDSYVLTEWPREA